MDFGKYGKNKVKWDMEGEERSRNTLDGFFKFPLRKKAVSEPGPLRSNRWKPFKCQSVLERGPAQCVRDPGRRSSHQSG